VNKTREASRAAVARFKLRHPERYARMRREAVALYAQRHPERVKARFKRWYDSHKDSLDYKERKSDNHRSWRERNREHVNAMSRETRKRHRDYYRAYAVWNQMLRRNGGSMQRQLVAWIRQQPCIDCGSCVSIEVGHRVAVRNGGTNDADNLIPQCRACNRRLSGRNHTSALLQSAA
jgi:hypothetical protein